VNTVERMREKLGALAPQSVAIVDESEKHAGHEGAKAGGGHYVLTIVSNRFAGKPTVARHRMVYDTLAELMRREIHALTIRAFSPDEI
jgi:BolA family transcriptional regulator, general stress-responsive regulator